MVLSQGDGDAADSVAGLHVSILDGLSELILEGQNLRDQLQQSVDVPAASHTLRHCGQKREAAACLKCKAVLET